MKTVGFSSSPRFVEHITGPTHPERPDRIRAIYRALTDTGVLATPDPFPSFKLETGLKKLDGPKLLELTPKPAETRWLELCHTSQMIEYIKHVCAAGGGVLDLGDTVVSKSSYDIALLSCGSLLVCCDAVMSGKVDRAFSAARPPGHHAEPDRPMGFCLFCNAAIAARYIQHMYDIERVAIVDFDVHHGNGTQSCLETDPTVLYISLHQHPRTIFPGSGNQWETGVGAGEGATLNVPIEPGTGDEKYLAAFTEKVLPKLDSFKPEFLLMSAGFDGHAADPLASLELSDDCFQTMTELLVKSAETHCKGRVISTLEGGYDLKALGRCVVRHLVGLASGSSE